MKRKNPYSLVDVNLISIEVLARERAGQKAAVGVDVAKSELVMCLVWPDRSFERPWSFNSPGQIRLAVGKLLELNRACPVRAAMESSGTYGDAFRQALEDAGLKVQRVSSKAVKDDSEGFVTGGGGGTDNGVRAVDVSGRSAAVRQRRGPPQGDGIEPDRTLQRAVPREAEAEQTRA